MTMWSPYKKYWDEYEDKGSTVLKVLVDQVEKEDKGYKILKDDIIKCANCNKPLINVVSIKKTDDKHAIKVFCPYCKDCSFWYQVNGKIITTPINNLNITDINTNKRNDILFTEIKVKINGKT